MIKPAFYIRAQHFTSNDANHHRLLVEVNAASLGYILLDLKKMSPSVIKYYQFATNDQKMLDELLKEIIEGDELLTKDIGEIFIVYNFEESNLVPEKFFDPGTIREMTDLVHGNLHRGIIYNEKIPWWELHNIYRISVEVDNLFAEKFSSLKRWHAYSLMLKGYKMFHAKGNPFWIKAIFYEDKMVVIVFKDSKLQMVQTFFYQDRKDVLYYLLNCCKQFELDPEKLILELSGLIDKQSALFNELQKYFLNISFEQIDYSINVTEELKEYPLHYFSSLLRMAVCV